MLDTTLDVIISVGYRVKSKRGTQFRIWATQILKDYLLRGYAIQERLNRIENNPLISRINTDFSIFFKISKTNDIDK